LRALLQLLAVVMLLGMPFQTLLPIFVHGRHTMGWLPDTTARPVATERVSVDWVGREP
jgi:hypothetical protein